MNLPDEYAIYDRKTGTYLLDKLSKLGTSLMIFFSEEEAERHVAKLVNSEFCDKDRYVVEQF